MDVTALQRNLAARRLDPGPVDGAWGPKTLRALLQFGSLGHARADLLEALPAALLAEWPHIGVITPMRIKHFLAQAIEETDYLKTLVEYGDESYFHRYDGRRDLGNTRPGDGYLMRGRGIFQLTGRSNYGRYGLRIGVDLVADPGLAAQPPIAVKLACVFWAMHNCNVMADLDDIEGITRAINGGVNGLPARRAILANLDRVFPD